MDRKFDDQPFNTSLDNVEVVGGVDETGKVQPLPIEAGKVKTDATFTGTINLGDIRIQDHTTTDKAHVTTSKELQITGAVTSVDLGAKADTTATTDTGTFSLISLVKRLLQRFNSGIVVGTVEITATELVTRMLNKLLAVGYLPWLDTNNASFLYVLEAPAAAVATDTGFRGIRITKDGSGFPVGKVQVNSGGTLTFNNRSTDGGWA